MTTEQDAAWIAAKFSDNPLVAVTRYKKLTGQEFDSFDDAITKLRSLLPVYRWPVGNEAELFFNPFESGGGIEKDKNAQLTIVGTSDTPAMTLIKNMMPDADEDMKAKLENAYQALYDVPRLEHNLELVTVERDALQMKIDAAQDIYHSDSFTGSNKNKARDASIVRSLKLHEKKTSRDKLYKEYIHLVRREGMEIKEAIAILTNKYDLPSKAACAQRIRRALDAIHDDWNNALRNKKTGKIKKFRSFVEIVEPVLESIRP